MKRKLKITDLRIGDVICGKADGFPMTVTGLSSVLGDDPEKGTVYADFEGNEGGVWEFDLEDVVLLTPIKNKKYGARQVR